MALPGNKKLKLLIALAAGAVATLALPPFDIWPCMFAGISLLYILLARTETGRGALAVGWCFGFGYYTAGLWWIANAMLVPGNPFNWVWPLAVGGLPALLAFFPALAATLAHRYGSMTRASGFLAAVACFAAFEWLRGHVFTGFPWNMYGYAWNGTPQIMQTAAIGGSYSLTLITFFWAALPGFLAVSQAGRKPAIVLFTVAVLSAGLCVVYGQKRLAEHPTKYLTDVAVRAVQPNIPQEEKWDPQKAGVNLMKLLSFTGPDADAPNAAMTFIIWPETAITWQAIDHPGASQSIRDTLARHEGEVYLMTGYLRRDKEKNAYYNSLAVFDRDLNTRDMFDKFHLVPFGEYIPLKKILSFIGPLATFESFHTGHGPATLSAGAGPSFSPLVCYEVIFPGNVTARGPRPAWIVNVTNDAWYGDSPGPRQHFAQARMRAIEEGLPLVRAANTGISGVIDPVGRIVDALPLDQAGARTISLPQALDNPPLYAKWGDSLFLAAISLIMAFSLLLRRKSK